MPGLPHESNAFAVPSDASCEPPHSRLKRMVEDLREHVVGQDHGIALHAAGPLGFVDDVGDVLGSHAVARQAEYAQALGERVDPCDAGFGRRRAIAGQAAGDLVKTGHETTGEQWIAADRFEVGAHDQGQQSRTHGAVWSRKHAAERTREPVHGPEFGVGQRFAA